MTLARGIHRECLSGIPRSSEEDRFERADGSVQYLRWAIEPWRDADGKVAGILLSTEDITPYKKAQDELFHTQKLASLGTLAGGVAHDFNNILGILSGGLDILEHGPQPDATSGRAIKRMRDTVEQASALTRQLLGLARRTAGDDSLQVDLAETLPGLVDSIRLSMGETGLQLTLAPDLPRVQFDPVHFQQVLTNLCVNARDAMPKGGLVMVKAIAARGIELSGRFPGLLADRYVALSIEDTGEGISYENQKHIFEPFFTTRGEQRGTGLGLSIVYSLVMQHRGLIDVASVPGAGTTVRLYLRAASR